MKWKEFFYYTRTERQGIIVLVALVAIAFIIACYPPKPSSKTVEDTTFNQEYNEFIASLQVQQQQERKQATRFQPRTVILAPFDPNTTDSVGFLNLGLPPWMAKNILRYRAKGGKFRQPEDFKKIYGLTEKQYTTLLPYMEISELFSKKDTVRLYTRHPKQDSLAYFKYPPGTLISLNQSDTTELKKIPGIGSGIARMIVGYREKLGGFYRIEQLKELRLSTDSLRRWLSVYQNETRRMNLNKVSIERLSAHPYINFYQAKVIVEYRKKKGKLNNLRQLALYEEFTPQDFERIAPYVCFE